MPQPLRVLIVEDRPTDAELIVFELRRAGFSPEWRRVDNEADFIAALRPDWEIILCDYAMPGFSGLRALEIAREHELNIPFIIVSGTIGEETAVAAMKQGAADYLMKDRMVRLGPAVATALDQNRLRREREQAQESMRQSEHKYRQLFESLSEAAFLIEQSSRRILDTNRRAEEILGRTRAEVLGMDASLLFPAGKAAEYGRRLVSAAPTPATGPLMEALLSGKDGNEIPVQISLAPVSLYGRNLVLALMTDITVRKQVEESLLKAKAESETANQAKDQFIAMLSHELRTPLTPILLALSELESDALEPGEYHSRLEDVRRSVELEVKLIDDLLDVTGITRGKIRLHKEVVDVHACVRDALEICHADIDVKQLFVSLKLNAALRHVWADPTRLRQVIWNLLKNAVKFTPGNGRITISSSNIDVRFHLEISDTGIGIEPSALPRIFNVFEQGEQSKTRRYGGLGIGLSIARSLMELHEGTLTASSEGAGKGATFTLEIAAIPDVKEPRTAARAPELQSRGSKKILLVEDHVDTLRLLARMLRRWGYPVVTADSAQAALEEAAKEPFDLLVSDLGLPDGDGWNVMKEVKKLYGVRGLAISGFGTADDIRRSHDAGFEEHIVKPVSGETLHEAVERIALNAA